MLVHCTGKQKIKNFGKIGQLPISTILKDFQTNFRELMRNSGCHNFETFRND